MFTHDILQTILPTTITTTFNSAINSTATSITKTINMTIFVITTQYIVITINCFTIAMINAYSEAPNAVIDTKINQKIKWYTEVGSQRFFTILDHTSHGSMHDHAIVSLKNQVTASISIGSLEKLLLLLLLLLLLSLPSSSSSSFITNLNGRLLCV